MRVLRPSVVLLPAPMSTTAGKTAMMVMTWYRPSAGHCLPPMQGTANTAASIRDAHQKPPFIRSGLPAGFDAFILAGRSLDISSPQRNGYRSRVNPMKIWGPFRLQPPLEKCGQVHPVPSVIVCVADDESGKHEEKVYGEITVVQYLICRTLGIGFQQMECYYKHRCDPPESIQNFVSRFRCQICSLCHCQTVEDGCKNSDNFMIDRKNTLKNRGAESTSPHCLNAKLPSDKTPNTQPK